MRRGTKSLLFGVHQVLYHPLTVVFAWHHLYARWPGVRELVCIAIHDWGYFGKPSMDGAEGERHPELGAKIAGFLFGPAYRDLCLFHSRHYSRLVSSPPSALCWADKLHMLYYPEWLYLTLASLSGELAEYRQTAHDASKCPLTATDHEWFHWVRNYLVQQGHARDPKVVAYINPDRRPKPFRGG